MKPHEIEIRSMEIIDALLPMQSWSLGEVAVVKRLVHTSGDPTLADMVRIHPEAIAVGVAALRRGAPIFTDVQMVRMGMNAGRLEKLGATCRCLIDDPLVMEQARQQERTRAQTAMRCFGVELDGAIVAIGNAPTALREVLALANEGVARPALVIGMPVGFVDAAESKAALLASELVYIAIEGTRGGSPLAAATVNALLRVLEGRRDDYRTSFRLHHGHLRGCGGQGRRALPARRDMLGGGDCFTGRGDGHAAGGTGRASLKHVGAGNGGEGRRG